MTDGFSLHTVAETEAVRKTKRKAIKFSLLHILEHFGQVLKCMPHWQVGHQNSYSCLLQQ